MMLPAKSRVNQNPKYFIYSFSFMALLLILIVIRFFIGLL